MQILKNTAIISIFTLISQLLGVLRDKLLISIVGVGVTLDIYNAAFKIPDLLIAVLVSFVGITVIVPFLTSSLVKNSRLELEKKFATLFVFFNSIILLFSIIIIFTLDLFLHRLFPAFTPENLVLLSAATKLMLVQPMLMGMSNLFACLAQTYKNFIYYAMAPIFYNLGIIFGIVFLYEKYNLMGLVYGVLIGAFLHIFINSIFIFKNRVDVNLAYFDFKYIREILPVAGWRSIAFIIISLKQFSITIVSGLLGAGIITVWTFALNLVNMCVQFFATSYAIASFPVLSEYYEKGEMDILESTIKKNVKEIFLYSIIFSMLMFFLAKFAVGIIYNSDARVLELFYILIVAIPFLNLEQYYARAMMAIHKVKMLSFMHVLSFVFLVISLYTFYKNEYNYTFIAYAYLSSTIIQVMILYILGQKSLKRLLK